MLQLQRTTYNMCERQLFDFGSTLSTLFIRLEIVEKCDNIDAY